MRKEERSGKGQKEEQPGKHKEKRHSIFAKEEKCIQQEVGKGLGGPDVQIARNTIDMKPDDHQTGDGPDTIEYGERMFLWDVSYLGLYPPTNHHNTFSATCSSARSGLLFVAHSAWMADVHQEWRSHVPLLTHSAEHQEYQMQGLLRLALFVN